MRVWLQGLVVRWKLFYFYIVFLVLLSVLPINSSSNSTINDIFVVTIRLDYLLHCLVNIPLILFLYIDKGIELFRTPVKTVGWVILLLIFAVVTEWIQYFLPYRAFNINDMIANALGVLLGVFFMIALSYKPVRVIK